MTPGEGPHKVRSLRAIVDFTDPSRSRGLNSARSIMSIVIFQFPSGPSDVIVSRDGGVAGDRGF